MNASQKKYTCERIAEIQRKSAISCSCQAPCLGDYLRRGAVNGVLQLKSTESIQAKVAESVVKNRSSLTNFVAIEDVFEPTKEYQIALAAHKDSEEAVAKSNERRAAKFQELIDQVNLGKFKDGEQAIKAALNIK